MRRNEENFDYILKKYEAARAKGGSVFMEAADLLDIYDYYAENFRHEDAKEVLMRAVKLYPEDDDIIIAHAYYHKHIGDWNKAENIIEKLSSDSIYRKLFYAEKALILLELDKSRRLINEIANSGEEFTYDIALDIAEMYYETGYYHLAEPWLQKCNTPKYTEFTRAASELADCLFRRSEINAAIAVMNKCLDEDPYNAGAWVQLAKIQYTAQKNEDALESCNYAIAANKDYAEAYTIRYEILLQLNKFDEMWKSLQNPAHQLFCPMTCYLNLAYGFEKKEEFDKASQVYHLAARHYTEEIAEREQIHQHLAQEAVLQGRLNDARDLILRNTNYGELITRYLNYSALLFANNHRDKAVKNLRDTITLPNIGVKDLNDISTLLYNADCYHEAFDIWESIFPHANDEEMESYVTLAIAAYKLHNDLFPQLLESAIKADLYTTALHFNKEFHIYRPEVALLKAKELVRQWKKNQ